MKKLVLYIIIAILLPLLSSSVVSCSLATRSSKPAVTGVNASLPLHDALDSLLDPLGKTVPGIQAATIDTALQAAKIIGDSLVATPDSLISKALEAVRDSSADSVAEPAMPVPDSVPRGRKRIVTTKDKDFTDIDAVVEFSSTDSMIILRRDSASIKDGRPDTISIYSAEMFGNGTVTYDRYKISAYSINMDLADNTVTAVGLTDSLGETTGKPVFSEKDTEYEAQSMRFNFKTKKGYIQNVVTQQGEGYLTGGRTKRDADENLYVEHGRYTTCDDHDCPHFYFQLTKAKVRPGKNIVMGPAYMVLAGLPLPLAVPFGFFPFTDDYASGVIVPTFGDDYQRGFYLSDGGYYFALSKNMDLALTGELYTKGSWGLRAQSSYVKRYKFSGSFNVSYLKTIIGEKGSPDYSARTNFQVLWNHSQDAKANPNMTLSASVNFTTSGYSRNDLGSYYSSAFTENTKSSSVNMTYRFPQSKWSLSTTLNISQRTQDSTLAVSFPNFTLTMSQTNPFKRKIAKGSERWYEKIKLSYNGQFQNSLTSKQDEFFKKSLIKDWRNAMRHSVPISATFNFAKYINITPSLNFTDRMYTRKVRQSWDEVQGIAVADTTYSFYNVWDFNAALSMDTKIYGFYTPVFKFIKDKFPQIRHTITPTLSFSASPDFGSPFFGYYGSYDRPMADGTVQTMKYSMFPNSLYGVPGQGKTGALSLSLANNVQMKVSQGKTAAGTDSTKVVSLIENLSLSQSYNFAADSLRFSDLNSSILLRLTKGFNLNLSATWDVYTYALNSYGNPVRVNKLRIASGKGYGKLRSTGTSFSYTLNNDTFKKLFKKDGKKEDDNSGSKDEKDRNNRSGSQSRASGSDTKKDDEFSDDGYMVWSVPWSLSINYSINYGYGAFNKQKMEYDSRITQNLSFSGNLRPTKGWNFSFSSSYNFDTKRIAYMNCNISRDLHCFTMTASFVPLGPYKSYNFHIAVKSALLSDFKYDKRSSISNGVQWY